ncbi:MAG: c-type cytochrome [Bacteroidota bacterium]
MLTTIQRYLLLFGTIILFLLQGCLQDSVSSSKDHIKDENWAFYLGAPSSTQFKDFTQINSQNVSKLTKVWEYHAGDKHPDNRSQIQCNPLIIDGVLYGTSPKLKLFALDAKTGQERWKFDPSIWNDELQNLGVNRGMTYWEKGNDKRILYTVGSDLYAIDIDQGKPVSSFGVNGKVNLKEGLGRDMDKTYYGNNTPGIIYKDVLIIGGRVSEGADHAPGHIRAFDVRNGKLKWMFHTIPHPGEFGYDSWPDSAYLKSGGANVWAGFSMDEEEGIVYAPTGSASFDFYGGDRKGENLFANSIIAIKAETGERLWHFQCRHHDLWDRDLPAPPNLIEIQKDGKTIKALAQITKSGRLFVLDRLTGDPIYPIEEVKAPPTNLDGEEAWPTQPHPTVFPPFSRTSLSEKDLAIRSEEAAAFAKDIWKSKDHGEFIPPSEKGKILFPGMDGGGEWGGAAYDPQQSILYVNSNEMSWNFKMKRYRPSSLGQSIYQGNCQSCHAEDFKGNQLFGNVPSLVGVEERRSKEEMASLLKMGKGVMPAFSKLSEQEIESVIAFVSGEAEQEGPFINEGVWPYPYFFEGYQKLKAKDGLPIIRPPWGQLTAIDMNKAEILWQVPLGNIDSLNIPGHPNTGIENYGGPVVTSGNLLFIAATADEKFRVFDKRTGKMLKEFSLPAAGYATPATYMIDGKQFVVIACGGGKLGTQSGDSYIAFSLEE